MQFQQCRSGGICSIQRWQFFRLYKIPEVLFLFPDIGDVLLVSLDALHSEIVTSNKGGDIPVVGTGNCHVVHALAVVGIRHPSIFWIVRGAPLFPHAEVGGLDFKASILPDHPAVDICQHVWMIWILQGSSLVHLLSGYHLEASGDDRLELCAEPDLGISGKIVRFHHADFFCGQAIGALVRVQSEHGSAIGSANALGSYLEPFFSRGVSSQNQCRFHCVLPPNLVY